MPFKAPMTDPDRIATAARRFSPHGFGWLVVILMLLAIGTFVAVRMIWPDFVPELVLAGGVCLFMLVGLLRQWGARQGYMSCPACGHSANHPGRANEYVSPHKYRPQRICNNCFHDLTLRLPANG